MMEILGRGDVAMNLVGLILIAALSGGIVAVSLRLRASASSARMWIESDRLPEKDSRTSQRNRRRAIAVAGFKIPSVLRANRDSIAR